jgi:hypothetical protein
VRILDGAVEIARHQRTYDRRQRERAAKWSAGRQIAWDAQG